MTKHRFLSAYFTLPPADCLRRGQTRWTQVFPFNEPYGAWTFSGRVALFAGLKQIGLRPGSAVLVPSYFQGTEVDTLLAAGFKLRFYAVDENFMVDLTDVDKNYTDDVSALYIIHYFGLPQSLKPLEAFCKQKGIALIEDCALSLFSKDGDTWLGSRGDISLFSVYKSVPLPHGGYLVTKRSHTPTDLRVPPLFSTVLQTADLLAQHIRGASANGLLDRMWTMSSEIRKGVADTTVVSGTITLDSDSLQYGASSIVPRLMKLANPQFVIAQRRANFELLHSKLRHLSVFTFDALAAGACPLFYPIVVEDKIRFRADLAARGIGSVNLWSQPHPACPNNITAQTANWRRTILELPIHQQLNEDDIERIAEEVLALTLRGTIAALPVTLTKRALSPDALPLEAPATVS
jgi:perosamine synthetase